MSTALPGWLFLDLFMDLCFELNRDALFDKTARSGAYATLVF